MHLAETQEKGFYIFQFNGIMILYVKIHFIFKENKIHAEKNKANKNFFNYCRKFPTCFSFHFVIFSYYAK